MEYTFGGKYKLEEEIGYGGCGTSVSLRVFLVRLNPNLTDAPRPFLPSSQHPLFLLQNRSATRRGRLRLDFRMWDVGCFSLRTMSSTLGLVFTATPD